MVQAILVLQQIEQNTKGNNNSGIHNRAMGHSIITATDEQYKWKINRTIGKENWKNNGMYRN